MINLLCVNLYFASGHNLFVSAAGVPKLSSLKGKTYIYSAEADVKKSELQGAKSEYFSVQLQGGVGYYKKTIQNSNLLYKYGNIAVSILLPLLNFNYNYKLYGGLCLGYMYFHYTQHLTAEGLTEDKKTSKQLHLESSFGFLEWHGIITGPFSLILNVGFGDGKPVNKEMRDSSIDINFFQYGLGVLYSDKSFVSAFIKINFLQFWNISRKIHRDWRNEIQWNWKERESMSYLDREKERLSKDAQKYQQFLANLSKFPWMISFGVSFKF